MISQLEVVRLIAPEFAAISDLDVQKFLDLSPLFIDAARVPESQRGLALALQACILMLNQANSADGASHGGALTMEKEGDLQRQYGFSTSGSAQARRNIYEQQLDALYAGILGGNIMMRYTPPVC